MRSRSNTTAMDQLLLIFSLAFILLMLLMVVVPYWRQRRDLLNSWTLFLFGSATFVGLSGINAATSQIGYADYSPATYLWYFAGVLTFYVTLALTYFKFRWPQRVAMRRFNAWPTSEPTTLMFILPFCLAMSLLLLFLPNIQGLAQFIVIVGKNGVVFATIFALVVWIRQPHNPVLIYVSIAVLLFAIGFSMLSGGSSRRDLVAVLASLPLVVYWMRFRYARPIKTLIVVGFVGLFGVLLINGYSTFRHSLQQRGPKDFATLVQAVADLPSKMFRTDTGNQMLGQNAVEASLLAIHVYQTERWPGFEKQPFHSVEFVLVNPIPRAFWPQKPEAFGQSLPRETGKRTGVENWGPGIVGHGFFEGGLHVLVVYAIVAGIVMRLFDDLMMRFPSNPYLLGILAANSGQIIGWSRGDIGVFTVQIIGGLIAAGIILLFARALFGVVQPHVGYYYANKPVPSQV